ncbi:MULTISPECIES: SAM-dependent methyltransferase [unclassified Nocardiopsis]|uniref:SAM-dependent methyltransferase n=1 Tax=Nocardiopsis TaxID=2013 RepID=UPI00387A9AB1
MEGATRFIGADLREIDTMSAAARETLDFNRHIGLTLMGTMGHFGDVEETLGIVRTYLTSSPA